MQAIVTGAGGLVGSSAVERLAREGWDVVGVDNNLRRYFFGDDGSTADVTERLVKDNLMTLVEGDIRERWSMLNLFRQRLKRGPIGLIVHTAAQPSHDWAATHPHMDFEVNALGTLNLLEATRKFCIDAPFCHISTSKVYGDNPNFLPLNEHKSRLDLAPPHDYYNGIKSDLSIDHCKHSLFGVSKASGDLLVQEYGRYFDMPTIALRPGCVTGSAHSAVEMHGFLAYLMKCAVTDKPYTIYGYKGKQVRCNITADDLVSACLAYADHPGMGGLAYNIGGGRESACSVLEAIQIAEAITGKDMDVTYDPQARSGDHRWWISDISEFQFDHPTWAPTSAIGAIMREIHDGGVERWG